MATANPINITYYKNITILPENMLGLKKHLSIENSLKFKLNNADSSGTGVN